MVLYLSSPQHTNLLDFIGGYEPEDGKVIKKLVGQFSLKQFIVYDMRNFSQFADIVLDRIAFGDTDGEFVQAIEEFLTMYTARVTVIHEGLMQSNPFFGTLIECGVRNLVCGTEIGEIQQEIAECLSGEGMLRYVQKGQQGNEKQEEAQEVERYRFGCKNVGIVVMGTQPRMGTTTVTVGLCVWLARVGASVCYVDANRSRCLERLAKSYGMEQEADGWRFEGVHFSSVEPQEEFQFVVYDFGADTTKQYGQNDLIKNAGQRLLVCGTKPYELGFSARRKKEFAGMGAWLLCPFVADGIREEMAGMLQDAQHKVRFLDYQPELTDGEGNAGIYKEIVAEYIVEP